MNWTIGMEFEWDRPTWHWHGRGSRRIRCTDSSCAVSSGPIRLRRTIQSLHLVDYRWTVVADGSVPQGAELRTGWGTDVDWFTHQGKILQQVFTRIQEDGWTPSPRCGWHVHVGHPSKWITAEAREWITHYGGDLEDFVFQQEDPYPERRLYCRPWSASMRESLSRRPWEDLHFMRYHAVNLQSIWKHGTIELRGWNSTTDLLHVGHHLLALWGWLDRHPLESTKKETLERRTPDVRFSRIY